MDIEVLDKLYYTIGEVAEMLNTSSSQLRYWSGEFNLNVRKNRKGDRLFQKSDLEKLKNIQVLLKDEGYTIEGAKKKLKSDGKSLSIIENSTIETFNSMNTLPTPLINNTIIKDKLYEIKCNLELLKVQIDTNL